MNVYYLDLIPYFNLYHEFTIPKGIETLKALISNKDNKIILSAVWEIWPHEKILSALEILGVTPNQENVVLLLDVYSYSEPNHWTEVNTVLYDSLLCRVHKSENPELGPNLDNDKILFKLGTPYKKQRIFTLYELYQRNELDKCEWSLHYESHLEDAVRCYLPNMSDDAYQRFITDTAKKIDDVSPNFGTGTTNFYPISFNPTAEMYAKTAVSLVTETTFHPELYWFITEKTWKAINNFHPFVLIGYKKTYEYLYSLGIDTFQYAVKHPYETLVGPEEDVIRMCVDNVLHLLSNKDQYREELTKSVIHNKKVFTDLANMYNSKVNPYIEDLIWNHSLRAVEPDNAVAVYEKLWGKYGAVGED
jgi:hypothetical protein